MQWYSSAEIKINNPVLFEILKKYKDKGAFINSKGFDLGDGIGGNERELKYGNLDEFSDADNTPVAFYYFEAEMALIHFAPNSIENVADCIFDVILGDQTEKDLKNKEIFEECKKEIHERAKEINENYIEVFWEAYDDSYDDSEYEDESWEDEDEEDDDGYDDSDSEEEGPDWAFYYKK